MHMDMKSGASRFAHLFGRPGKAAAKSAKAEGEGGDDDDKKKDDDADAKNAKAEGEGSDDDDKKKDDDADAKSANAKAEDDDEDDADMNDGDDSDDDDDEKDKKDAKASGAKAERKRWTSVLEHKAAAGHGETAVSLLAESGLSASRIISVLETLPAAAKSARLGDRMASQRQVNPGAGGSEQPTNTATATAQAILAAARKARGEV